MEDYYAIIFLLVLGGFIFWLNRKKHKNGYPRIGRSELLLMSSLYLYSHIHKLEKLLLDKSITDEDRAWAEREIKQANYQLDQINFEEKDKEGRRYFG